MSTFWRGLTENTAQTDPHADDPRLRGRTYAIPFDTVWRAAVDLADGGIRGWSLVHADDEAGRIRVESRTLIFRFVDDVRIRIGLDENGQTRVDLHAASRKGKGDLGRNPRTIGRFLRRLDRALGATPAQILDATRSVLLSLALLLALGACRAGESPPPQKGTTDGEAGAERNFQGRIYERNFVFTTLGRDTAFVVPWLFTVRTRPGGVERHIRGWLARGETWDAFYDEVWEGPPSRAPWRILPRGPLRLVVGENDAVENIVFEAGPRALELELGEALAEWAGPEGETLRIHDGSLYLADRRLPGLILDMARSARADQPAPGDWMFLVSGDSLQMVVERPFTARTAPADSLATYRAWARLDFRTLQWPEVRVTWSEVRSYEPARRDVPQAWTLSGGEPALAGTITAETARLQAGDGAGPTLPVDAVFLVAGDLVLQGRTFPVRGFVRHARP